MRAAFSSVSEWGCSLPIECYLWEQFAGLILACGLSFPDLCFRVLHWNIWFFPLSYKIVFYCCHMQNGLSWTLMNDKVWEVRCLQMIFSSTETDLKVFCSCLRISFIMLIPVAMPSVFFPVITVLCSGPCLKDYVVVDSKQKHVFVFEEKVFQLPI